MLVKGMIKILIFSMNLELLSSSMSLAADNDSSTANPKSGQSVPSGPSTGAASAVGTSISTGTLSSTGALRSTGTGSSTVTSVSSGTNSSFGASPSSATSGGVGTATGTGVQIGSSPRVDSLGPSDDGTPDLDKWVSEVRIDARRTPLKLAVVTALPKKGEPQFLELDSRKFSEAGFFKIDSTSNIKWDLKVNKKNFEKRHSALVTRDLTKADTVILAPPNGPWKVYRYRKTKLALSAKGDPPSESTEEAIVNWLMGVLGWDGVVLDTRDRWLLVGSSSAILKKQGLQALAIDNSATRIVVDEASRKGSGLLSLERSQLGYGIFETVFLGKGLKRIPVGTKIMIEGAKAAPVLEPDLDSKKDRQKEDGNKGPEKK